MPTLEKTRKSEYTRVTRTGNFPPFVTLEVDDEVRGEITGIHESKKTVGRGKKAHEVPVTRIHFTLSEAATLSIKEKGSKTHERRKFGAGESITLPDAGVLDGAFEDTVRAIEGLEKTDKVESLQPLVGVSFEIKRTPDGKVSKGEFKGNKLKMYEVGYKTKD